MNFDEKLTLRNSSNTSIEIDSLIRVVILLFIESSSNSLFVFVCKWKLVDY